MSARYGLVHLTNWLGSVIGVGLYDRGASDFVRDDKGEPRCFRSNDAARAHAATLE